MSFGPFDLVVVVVLGAGFFHGRAKGLSWQVSGIATLVLGYLAATAASSILAPLFPDAWPLDLKKFAAWATTYAVVCVAVYLATLKLSKKIKENELEELDRRFGGALGALKAGLILAVLSLAAVATSERAREVVKESASGVLLARAAFAARPVLPERIGDAVGKIAGEIAPTAAAPVAPVRPAPPKPAPARPVPVTPARPLPGAHRLEPAPRAPSTPPARQPAVADDHEGLGDHGRDDHDGATPSVDEPSPEPSPDRVEPEPQDPLAPTPRR